MMKKAKAFTIFEFLVFLAIIAILAAMLLPAIAEAKHIKHMAEIQKEKVVFNVGDVVYIDTLCITGIVNNTYSAYDWPHRIDLLVKGTNGMPTQLEHIDIRLLKKVPPTPENEWKR